MPANLIMQPVLTPAVPEDTEFLFQLYASTRAEELSIFRWDERQQAAFVRMQFAARERSYASSYPDAERSIVLSEGKRIGAVIVHRAEREVTLIDIALLPEARNRGLGTALIKDLIRESFIENKPVRLHVAKDNRAATLYYRLGFRKIGEDGMYEHMELHSNTKTSIA